uniref:TERF1 (TRF1)-interacting nuclear factor 2 n=1 Tax=Oryzias sinensis TaxID=183150 RepID=A0A8C8DJW5_9TELE
MVLISSVKTKFNASLPFAALQLLAPPVRLVSAALWKVLKQRDVMQYGVVEEFVTSACQTVPKLLTVRHQGKLALGLRARFILELCRTQHFPKQLEYVLFFWSQKNDVRALKRFLCFLSKEQFPVEYGPNFDKELEKLLWEFLIRLDQLLPVPNLTQTVSWLSNAPPVLEECAQAATQPQLLKILLEHQSCLGHLESAASLPPNMGDSILTSLSLPPSGRTASNPSTESNRSPSNPPRKQPADTTPFITPVIGLISNEDVPAMISARKKSMQADKGSRSKDAANKQRGPKESPKFTLLKEKLKPNDDQGQEEDGRSPLNKNTKRKRKQADKTESDSDDDEVFIVSRSAKKRESTYMHRERVQGANEDKEKGEERELCVFFFLLLIEIILTYRDLPLRCTGTQVMIFIGCTTRNRRKNVTLLLTDFFCLCLEMAGLFGVDDYVADSEDEGIKNFKGRVCALLFHDIFYPYNYYFVKNN